MGVGVVLVGLLFWIISRFCGEDSVMFLLCKWLRMVKSRLLCVLVIECGLLMKLLVLSIRLLLVRFLNVIEGVGVLRIVGCLVKVCRSSLWIFIVLVFSGRVRFILIILRVLFMVMLCMVWEMNCEFGMIIVEWLFIWILVVCMLICWILFLILFRLI